MKARDYVRRRRALEIPPPESLLGGPRRWLAGTNLLEEAAPELKRLGAPLIFFGEARLWRRVLPRLKAKAGGAAKPPLFNEFPEGGECCAKNVRALMKKLKASGARVPAGHRRYHDVRSQAGDADRLSERRLFHLRQSSISSAGRGCWRSARAAAP